ncbi:MAG: RlmE family RNA methyltransferase [Candidatus Thermoplasmatota archaeon]|nr:RlmE family RNA methyltransferase [Candidatus Thermoplasmatota archaeon]
MATRWYQEKKREHFYKEAKRQGYRARSAFKLKQIQKKFNVLKEGDIVIDLGAAPGGWSQVTKELVGGSGTIIGIDLLRIAPISGTTFLQGDMTESSSLQKITEIVGNKKADVVLSDMSPDISGNYSVDQARSIYLCKKALNATESLLDRGGNFICKVFEGEDMGELIGEVKQKFKAVKKFSPVASRKSSSEVYIVAKLYK